MPGILDAGDTIQNKTDKTSCPGEADILATSKAKNKINGVGKPEIPYAKS